MFLPFFSDERSMYTFRYKRKTWMPYKKITVIGHKIEQNILVLFLKDGGIERLSGADRIDFKLDHTWALFNKDIMEKQAGQPVPVKPE